MGVVIFGLVIPVAEIIAPSSTGFLFEVSKNKKIFSYSVDFYLYLYSINVC
jgi:hypothetical protein